MIQCAYCGLYLPAEQQLAHLSTHEGYLRAFTGGGVGAALVAGHGARGVGAAALAPRVAPLADEAEEDAMSEDDPKSAPDNSATTEELVALNVSVQMLQKTLTHLEGTMVTMQKEVTSSSADLKRDVVAAVDRLERSFSSLDARLEAGEQARREQYEFIKTQLKRAQDERQVAVTENRDDNRDEIGRGRAIVDDNRQKATEGLKALWHMGGKYIVYAAAAYFVAKLAGVNLDLSNLGK